MIEIRNVTKRFGRHVAVDDVSFTVRPGVVTGFLGPNGAGKSTTMKMIVGLLRPQAGSLLVNGRSYASLSAPVHEIGVLLDAGAVHPRRSARHHLAALAATNGISRHRVDEVLAMVGLQDVAQRHAGGFSLGMTQRLGIATALLGDPSTVILDEPVNGLDPEGIRWVRELLKGLAAEGRTVFLSSHLMSEMALTAEHLVILGRGRLLADISVEHLTASLVPVVRVRTSAVHTLRAIFPPDDVRGGPADDVVVIRNHTTEEIAERAAVQRIPIFELTPVETSLEDAYLRLTRDETEFHSVAGGSVPVPERSAVA